MRAHTSVPARRPDRPVLAVVTARGPQLPREDEGERRFREIYERWLTRVLQRRPKRSDRSEDLVFLNAWNEWGEGTHLEPCLRWGRQYLAKDDPSYFSA